MTIYIVTDMSSRFVAAFADEGCARRFILKQPGKFNMHDVIETELR